MQDFTTHLAKLRSEDPDIALVLSTFSELERIYEEALEAMGKTREVSAEVTNSAKVAVSFRQSPSTLER